ncbi:MAG: TIGR04283 family arsenosugar biosynthesis glycosyltransferase [Rhodothermales bacterium]
MKNRVDTLPVDFEARTAAGALRLSVVIPTLNEAARIGRLVEHLRRHADARLEDILVVDADSADGTASVADLAGARVIRSDTRCRAAQMNLGARMAGGNVLYFVHADALPPASFLDAIERALAQGRPMGCFRMAFDTAHPLLRVNAYCTRFDLPFCRGGDQTLFVTASLFEATGGYDEAHVIMEEYDWLRRARERAPFAILPETVTVSARKYRDASYLRVNLANACVYTLYAMGISTPRLRRLYRRLLHRYRSGAT